MYNNLPNRVIAMRREGRTFKQIAARLRTTVGTVAGILRRTRTQTCDTPTKELTTMPAPVPVFTRPLPPLPPPRTPIAPPEPAVEDIDPAEDEPVMGVLLIDLQPGMCKYPVHTASDGTTHRFCSTLALNGQAYCAEHIALVYTPLRPIRAHLRALGARR
jgi:hypothetical protein